MIYWCAFTHKKNSTKDNQKWAKTCQDKISKIKQLLQPQVFRASHCRYLALAGLKVCVLQIVWLFLHHLPWHTESRYPILLHSSSWAKVGGSCRLLGWDRGSWPGCIVHIYVVIHNLLEKEITTKNYVIQLHRITVSVKFLDPIGSLVSTLLVLVGCWSHFFRF